MKYGFIGLGNLGQNLAGSLVREGFQVTLTDVNPAAAESLLQRGARSVPTRKPSPNKSTRSSPACRRQVSLVRFWWANAAFSRA